MEHGADGAFLTGHSWCLIIVSTESDGGEVGFAGDQRPSVKVDGVAGRIALSWRSILIPTIG